MSPELRTFLEAMQQDFHTTYLIALWSTLATLALVAAMFVWGWLTTARIRQEMETYAGQAEARLQAILAEVRRQP
jgi:multidrug resistance efflux pump